MGDDGLHKADWMRDTFKDLSEDLAEANAEGKRLMLIVRTARLHLLQRRCTKRSFPKVADYIDDNYFVVQMNLHGDRPRSTDFDGEVLEERRMARKWGLLFTPTMMFLPEEVEDGASATQAAVAVMPGAFGAGTTLDMLTWVVEKRYLTEEEEDFQRYHARRIQERSNGSFD